MPPKFPQIMVKQPTSCEINIYCISKWLFILFRDCILQTQTASFRRHRSRQTSRREPKRGFITTKWPLMEALEASVPMPSLCKDLPFQKQTAKTRPSAHWDQALQVSSLLRISYLSWCFGSYLAVVIYDNLNCMPFYYRSKYFDQFNSVSVSYHFNSTTYKIWALRI